MCVCARARARVCARVRFYEFALFRFNQRIGALTDVPGSVTGVHGAVAGVTNGSARGRALAPESRPGRRIRVVYTSLRIRVAVSESPYPCRLIVCRHVSPSLIKPFTLFVRIHGLFKGMYDQIWPAAGRFSPLSAPISGQISSRPISGPISSGQISSHFEPLITAQRGRAALPVSGQTSRTRAVVSESSVRVTVSGSCCPSRRSSLPFRLAVSRSGCCWARGRRLGRGASCWATTGVCVCVCVCVCVRARARVFVSLGAF